MHLKPCPFCGSHHLALEEDDDDEFTGPLYFMACLDCGTCGPAAYSEEEAANKWNTRAQKAGQ